MATATLIDCKPLPSERFLLLLAMSFL